MLPCAEEAFTETDQRYLQADSGGNRDDGCTAVTAVIVGSTVVVAHVGDSRAVLAKTGKGEQSCQPLRRLHSTRLDCMHPSHASCVHSYAFMCTDKPIYTVFTKNACIHASVLPGVARLDE